MRSFSSTNVNEKSSQYVRIKNQGKRDDGIAKQDDDTKSVLYYQLANDA